MNIQHILMDGGDVAFDLEAKDTQGRAFDLAGSTRLLWRVSIIAGGDVLLEKTITVPTTRDGKFAPDLTPDEYTKIKGDCIHTLIATRGGQETIVARGYVLHPEAPVRKARPDYSDSVVKSRARGAGGGRAR